MARHKRARVGLWVSRAQYMALRRRYEALVADYRALEADNALLIGDAEEAASGAPRRPVPSWAETEPIPVITSVGEDGLDPDKAMALTRRGGLLDSPSGEWALPDQGTSG